MFTRSFYLRLVALFLAALSCTGGNFSPASRTETGPQPDLPAGEYAATALPCLPDSLAGMSLTELKEDYRRRLFDLYLPFWLKGGYDSALGGFRCNLSPDGSPVDDEKNLWFQGRAVWVYSFLYNNFGRDPRYLEIASRTRDFMLKYMYAGEGRWYERVHRDGRVLEGVSKNVYGWLFAANGLAEYYKATHREEDLRLAKESLRAALAAYDNSGYAGAALPGDSTARGIRVQGHSMVIIRLLTQLLSHSPDPELETLAASQVDLLVNKFYNPEFGISNEYLAHDYSRLQGFADHMFTGHSIEVQWMLMFEALRIKDRALFNLAKDRFRRYLELSWDYIYAGFASGDFRVYGGSGRPPGTDYGMKTMWLECEVMVGCLTVLEYTGEAWARDWYERTRAFTLRTVAANSSGVWDQATDRLGKTIPRPEYHPLRRDNFHQARLLMLNTLSLERMLNNGGRRTPFPE